MANLTAVKRYLFSPFYYSVDHARFPSNTTRHIFPHERNASETSTNVREIIPFDTRPEISYRLSRLYSYDLFHEYSGHLSMKNQLKTHTRIYHETTHATFSRFLSNISLTTNNAIFAREQKSQRSSPLPLCFIFTFLPIVVHSNELWKRCTFPTCECQRSNRAQFEQCHSWSLAIHL